MAGWIKIVLACLAAIVLGAVAYYGMWLWSEHQRGLTAAARVDAFGRSQGAATAEGHDAVAATQAQGQAEAASEDLTRKNADAINAAPGAHAPVNPGLNDAGRRALCLRDAYRNLPACKQLLKPHP